MTIKEIAKRVTAGAETAASKEVAYAPATDYQWFEFTGPPFIIENKKGKAYDINKGDVFGVRKNQSATKIVAWIILAKYGTAKQMGADQEFAEHMAKHSKALKG